MQTWPCHVCTPGRETWFHGSWPGILRADGAAVALLSEIAFFQLGDREIAGACCEGHIGEGGVLRGGGGHAAAVGDEDILCLM